MTADAPQRSGVQPVPTAGVSLPPPGRLLKHSDFDRVYKQGRRHFSSNLTIFYLRRQADLQRTKQAAPEAAPANVTRIGFTVGRALGGAVDRNRIKRRLREAVRQRGAALAGTEPADVVINPKKSVLTLRFSLVLQEVGLAFDAVAKKLARK